MAYRSEEELRRLISEYAGHNHVFDEEEGGECSACLDLNQLEHELALVTGDWDAWLEK